MLFDTVDNASTNTVAVATNTVNRTPRGLLTIVELYHRAKKQHQKEPNSQIPRTILRDIISALHYRDKNTFLHSQRVGQLAVGLARNLCWNEETQFHLEIAALLHDIGKIGLPDHLLFKPAQFTGDETSLMALGTEVANDILQVCHAKPELRRTIVESRMPYSFLEDQNRPLGKEICLAGRLLAVADVYESLSRNQVYRDAFSHEQIIAHLNDNAGTQFDPNIVTALTRWLQPKVLAHTRELSDEKSAVQAQNHLEGSPEITALCNVFSDIYSLESSFDGFLIVDDNQEIVLLSRTAQNLFRIDDQGPQLKTWGPKYFPVFDSNQRLFPKGATPLEQVCKTKMPLTINVNMPNGSGKWIDVALQTLPLVDFKCKFQGVAELYKLKNPNQQKNAQYRELELQASRDALTGIANRGELENQLTTVMERFERDNQNNIFSAIYLDIDHFKNINDTYGHAVGDEVLVKLARLLQREAHSSELVARYGGEEFVIICPDLQLMQAAGRAERFRLEIAKLTFDSEPNLSITTSFGVAESETGDCLEDILKRSDQALYLSKEEGRNRTSVLRRKDMQESSDQAVQNIVEEDFTFSAEINAMLQKEILVMKLKGYVHDQKAKLISIEEGYAVIQVGHKGFFSKWGKNEQRQPIRIELDASDAINPTNSKAKNRKLKVKISPVGQPGSSEIFQYRARKALHEMSFYFLC